MAAEDGVDEALFPNKADLNEAENLWKQGEDEAKRSRPVGLLTMDITEAVLERASSSGRLQITYSLKIVGGASNGVEVVKRDGMSSPAQTAITQQQLQKIGIDTTKVSMKTLPAHLLNIKGKRMQVNAKINGDFYNISFIKPVTESLTGEPAAARARSGGVGKTPKDRKF